ncbi:MAG: hypothetical protein AAGI45_20055 [Cyanobacteria bacterium P01_H01_bin.26]
MFINNNAVVYRPIVVAGLAVQLLAQPALAHDNHDHSRSSDQPADEQDTAPAQPEASDTLPSATPAESDATPVVVEDPTPLGTQGELGNGFAIGLGESLLGLILVGPFLLISFKNISFRKMRN